MSWVRLRGAASFVQECPCDCLSAENEAPQSWEKSNNQVEVNDHLSLQIMKVSSKAEIIGKTGTVSVKSAFYIKIKA